ncbi:MAG TPA: ATP-dependent DNA ligase [Crinalium sp.]
MRDLSTTDMDEAIAQSTQATDYRNLGSALFICFAEVAEQVGATTKRLEKAKLLGQYFAGLEDADLGLAARYFAGYIFPLRDQRTINVGGAGLLAALVAVTKVELSTLQAKLVQLGDLGDVAAEVFPDQTPPSLTLADVGIALEQLARTKGSKQKVLWVVRLLEQASPVEAKYLVKLLLGDLRIGLKEGAVEDAIARLFHEEVGRIQWVNMLVGDIGETALLARQQQLDTAQMRLFHPIKFMLASPAADVDEVAKQMPAEFAVEDKFDGIRAQVHVAPAVEEDAPVHGTVQNNIRVALFSRTLDEITRSFPDLVVPIAQIPQMTEGDRQTTGLVLDGEIVPIQGDQILPFQELQKRLGRKTLSDDVLRSIPVAFVAYDVLYHNGRVLINEPFAVRRQILESLNLQETTLKRAVTQWFQDVEAIDAEFLAARDRGNEGLMIKDPNSTYKPGRRGKEWLKIKRALATLDVVVTAAEVGNGRRHQVLSDYTFAVRASETDPTLLNVGKAYSGLTDIEIAELSDWFRQHTIQEFAHGKIRLVEPKIVLEITFDRVQISKRHKSGFALRFPRILRIRDDKPAEEIDTLETVRKLAEGTHGKN